MRGLTTALALALTFGCSERGGAQERQGHVLPPGQLRLTVGAESFQASSRFGEPASLASEIEGPLTPATFSGAAQTADAVSAFLQATGGAPTAAPANPALLTAGTLSANLSSNYRYFPVRIGLGVLPRVELAVQLPVFRTESLFTRLALADSNVGLNSTSAPQVALLARLGPAGVALASSPLLPLADSPLGRELRQRVFALTGQNLALPDSAVTYARLLSRYPTVLPASRSLGAWQAGDLQIEGRFELLRSFSEPLFPSDSTAALDYRFTGVAAARIPTGRASDEAGFGLAPGVGHAGFRLGAVADLFFGRSYWVNTGGTLEMLGPGEVVVFDAAGPLSGAGQTTLRRSPGGAIELWLEPKLRLTQELAIGAVLRSEVWGEGRDDLAGTVMPLEGGVRHSLGASASYSTLAAPEAERGLPLEATMGFATAWAGTDGAPRGSVAYFQLSLLRRLWGDARH